MGLDLKKNHKSVIECANGSRKRKIITDDTHLYEPTAKKQKNKKDIKLKRKGCVCRYLDKQMRIQVGLCSHY